MRITDQDILRVRPARNDVSPWVPSAFFVESERTEKGEVARIATLFLTNRECPFRCLMCDLWKNTLTVTVPTGAIAAQIDYALQRLPPARCIKLYNSGNFFDRRAIPFEEHAAIAERVAQFETVTVENHPRLCGSICSEFQQRLAGELEIALGLETVHPEVLRRLNKRMTVGDYDRAVEFLLSRDIAVRTFILLGPPFLSESEGVEWCLRSLEHALARGSRVCSVVPVRGGNGIMEILAERGDFAPPTLSSVESVHETALRWNRGRVLVDLWDIQSFAGCSACADARAHRLAQQNITQQPLPPVRCDVCGR